MSKFKYMITPVRVIKLESMGNIGIRTPRTMDLTLDEVKACIKNAKIYRRFNTNNLQKVTISNCERLHNEKFMTEEEYADFLIKEKSENRGNVKSPEDTVKEITEGKDSVINKYAEKKEKEFKKDAEKIDKEIEEIVEKASNTPEVKEEEKKEESQPQNNNHNNNNKPNVNVKNNKKNK